MCTTVYLCDLCEIVMLAMNMQCVILCQFRTHHFKLQNLFN